MAKPFRSIQEINQDYFQTAATLGDLEWKMSKFPGQIEQLKIKLRAIDNEMDRLQEDEAKQKAKNNASPAKQEALKDLHKSQNGALEAQVTQ